MKTPLYTDYETGRDASGRFAGTPGPGRPKGSVSGRTMALNLLDRLMAEESTQERLADALREYFEADPVRFFKQIIMPLLPSEAVHKIQQETGTMRWVSIMESVKMREAAQKQAELNAQDQPDSQ